MAPAVIAPMQANCENVQARSQRRDIPDDDRSPGSAYEYDIDVPPAQLRPLVVAGFDRVQMKLEKVIPAHAEGVGPESKQEFDCLWIPGSPHRGAPE
jgi:hypothetical protein